MPHLLVVRGHGGSNIMGIEGTRGESVHQLDDVTVLDGFMGLSHHHLVPARKNIKCKIGNYLLLPRVRKICIKINYNLM